MNLFVLLISYACIISISLELCASDGSTYSVHCYLLCHPIVFWQDPHLGFISELHISLRKSMQSIC